MQSALQTIRLVFLALMITALDQSRRAPPVGRERKTAVSSPIDAKNCAPTPGAARLEGEAVWDGDGELGVDLGASSANPTPVPSGLTYDELFQVVSEPAFLDANMTVVADTFLGIYPAAAMRLPPGAGQLVTSTE